MRRAGYYVRDALADALVQPRQPAKRQGRHNPNKLPELWPIWDVYTLYLANGGGRVYTCGRDPACLGRFCGGETMTVLLTLPCSCGGRGGIVEAPLAFGAIVRGFCPVCGRMTQRHIWPSSPGAWTRADAITDALAEALASMHGATR